MELKYQSLANVLRERVLTSPSGHRLPSVRSLVKRHGCCLQTVQAALKQLEAEELIVSRRGSGNYVSDRRAVQFIAYHRARCPSRNIDAKEISLDGQIQAKGWHLEVRRHAVETLMTDLTPELKACAHIVNADLVNIQYPFFKHILQQPSPVIILGREADSLNLDSVTGNDRQILTLLVKHLRNLNHSRIAFLSNEANFFEIEQRRQLLAETLEMFDMPPAVYIDCDTEMGQSSTLAAHRGLLAYLEKNKQSLPFTALITASEVGGLGAMRAFHDVHLSVPRDCSIACFGMQDENTLGVPSITDCGIPTNCWGEWVVNLLKQRFGGDKSPRVDMKISPVLNIRESTGSARK